MAIQLHKYIPDAELHDPKGLSTANNGDALWRDETGSLQWNDREVLPSALEFVDASVAPPTTNSGDIYVLSSGGSVHANWGSVSLKDWVRYDGTDWNAITPSKSIMCYNENDDSLYSYDGSAWNVVGTDTNIGNSNITFDGNHYADLSTYSWTLGGTAPIGSEKISFQKDTAVIGSDNSTSTTGFAFKNLAGDSIIDSRNNGRVIITRPSGETTDYALKVDNSGSGTGTGGLYVTQGSSNFGFTIDGTAGRVLNTHTTGGQQVLSVGDNGSYKFNVVNNGSALGGGRFYNAAFQSTGGSYGGIGLGYGTDEGIISGLDKKIVFRMNASNSHTFEAGGNVIFKGTAVVGSEEISLQGDTLVGNTGDKVGFMGTAPIVQVTTGVAAASFVANTSGIADDTATFDGYTIGQITKALRNYGILA